MKIPYERLIAWFAGPLAAGIAFLATEVVHSEISHEQALNVATFVTTAIVTYAGQHKWMTNLAKWWDEMRRAQQAAETHKAPVGPEGDLWHDQPGDG